MKVNSHRRRRPGEASPVRGASLFRVRDWRVPTKLAAVLVLPAVAFLVIAGVQINTSVQNATRLDQFTQGIKVGRQLTDLIHQLQLERDRTSGVLARAAAGGPSDPASIQSELKADYEATDAAFGAFGKAAQRLEDNPLFAAGPPFSDNFRQLAVVREGVKHRWLRQKAVFDQYSATIQIFIDMAPDRAEIDIDAESARNVASMVALAEVKELTDQLRGRIFAACIVGKFAPDDFETFAEIQARQNSAIQRFRALASPRHLAKYDAELRGPTASAVARLQQEVIGRARGITVGTAAEEWWRSTTSHLNAIRSYEQDLLEDAIEGAADRGSTERRTAFVATSVIALIMIMALLLSWLIGRSMARSLRELRAQALDVAQHRLPEAIQRLRSLPRGETVTVDTTTRVRSSDEIGEVAEAFTAVHRSAVSLAVEQAVMRRNVNAMFINLARRSQTLVERQLQLLDQLESAETDPDQLANLFRLDHLATRMRRNDENLLVLAGSEATRRWAQPVSLSAVTLAAMAEIEQYARIRHDVSTDVHVVGHAVADIVHLLAELLENATTFSPPDTVVNVTGWPTDNGKEATIVIEDRGLGMTESGLREANERVSAPIAIDVAASERMGLVVVGHLAARHGVRVQLAGADEGVVAHVSLPARLLSAAPDGGGLYGGGATGRLTGVARLPIEPDGRTSTSLHDAPTSPHDAPVSLHDAPTTILPTLPIRPTGGEHGQNTVPLPPRIPTEVPAVAAPPLPPQTPAPTSSAPISGAPVSSTPVSSAPISSAPMSSAPVSAAPVSAVPVSGVPIPSVLASGLPARTGNGPARRPPSRAEDIIDAAARGNNAAPDKGSRWWSRGGEGSAPAPRIPAQREPVIGGTSNVGLPMRVPMAQLPGDNHQTGSGTTAPGTPAQPVQVPRVEVDPDSVSSMLTRFYSGVHRAANEDDVPTLPITDHRGARRDPEPTST